MARIVSIALSVVLHVLAFAALGMLVLSSGQSRAAPQIDGLADFILVEKSVRRMTLMRAGEVLAVFEVSLGGAPVGDKERQGDNRTPEGTYHIVSKNDESGFHLSLMTSYPDAEDRRAAAARGDNPGGDIASTDCPTALVTRRSAFSAMLTGRWDALPCRMPRSRRSSLRCRWER